MVFLCNNILWHPKKRENAEEKRVKHINKLAYQLIIVLPYLLCGFNESLRDKFVHFEHVNDKFCLRVFPRIVHDDKRANEWRPIGKFVNSVWSFELTMSNVFVGQMWTNEIASTWLTEEHCLIDPFLEWNLEHSDFWRLERNLAKQWRALEFRKVNNRIFRLWTQCTIGRGQGFEIQFAIERQGFYTQFSIHILLLRLTRKNKISSKFSKDIHWNRNSITQRDVWIRNTCLNKCLLFTSAALIA